MSQTADVEGHENINVQFEGDDNTVVIATNRKLLLSRYPRRRAGDGSDMAKLDPMAEAIELVGRETELTELDTWLKAPALISIRVMTGQGGVGKTRSKPPKRPSPSEGAWQAKDRTRFRMTSRSRFRLWPIGWKSWAVWTRRLLAIKKRSILLRHFLSPIAYAQQMIPILKDYLRRCEAAGVEAEHRLLASILEKAQTLMGWSRARRTIRRFCAFS